MSCNDPRWRFSATLQVDFRPDRCVYVDAEFEFTVVARGRMGMPKTCRLSQRDVAPATGARPLDASEAMDLQPLPARCGCSHAQDAQRPWSVRWYERQKWGNQQCYPKRG